MTTTLVTTDAIGTNLTYTFSVAGDIFALAAGTRIVADGYSYIYGTTAGITVMIDGYLWLQGVTNTGGSPFYFVGGDRITIGADAQMTLSSAPGSSWGGIMLGQNNFGGTDFSNAGQITLLGGNGFIAEGGNNIVRNSGTIDVTNGDINFDGTGGDALRNAGTITGRALDVIFLGEGANSVINTGHIDGNIIFGSGADTFQGIGGTVSGSVTGGDGADAYYTSDSALMIIEGAGATSGIDTVYSTVSFRLSANVEKLDLLGFAITGIGSATNNTVNGNGADNRIFGHAGSDSLVGYEGDDVVGGGSGNDTLRGSDGDDVLRGADDNDSLYGGGDNDLLTGGLGVDTMSGGSGGDRFIFVRRAESGSSVATSDLISDFAVGQDVIDLFGIDANINDAVPNNAFIFIGTSAFTNLAGQMRYSSAGGVTTLQMDTNGNGTADMSIRLTGTLTLTAQDFIL